MANGIPPLTLRKEVEIKRHALVTSCVSDAYVASRDEYEINVVTACEEAELRRVFTFRIYADDRSRELANVAATAVATLQQDEIIGLLLENKT